MMTTDNKVIILVPVYKKELNLLEQFSIDYLTGMAKGRKICFLAPQNLDKTYYSIRYPGFDFQHFEDAYFSCIDGYNQLLLSADFYQRFEDYSYMLIHQTDALLLRDDLDHWMASGFAYIGAPWPQAMTLSYLPEALKPDEVSNMKAWVGNGGFSLRSIPQSIEVLTQCGNLRAVWLENHFNEDCFFSFASKLAKQFRIPEPLQAALFALEMEPEHYCISNQGRLPMGGHAWWKYDLAFWQRALLASNQ